MAVSVVRMLIVALQMACTRPADPPQPPSLLLVTLDTTRADHIGAYGYTEAQTPTIDGLAEQGVRFAHAYATVPLTTPSHASIMTGLYPPRHGVRNNGDAIVSDDVHTLAEHLHDSGYRTGASVSAFVTSRMWNLDQGFDAYFDDLGSTHRSRWGQERTADAVVDDLVAWLPSEGGPFFAWAHFYDPHHPYTPPPGFQDGFPHPYDGEIAHVDAQLNRLLAQAEAAAGDGGLAVIVVADHGETLSREHGETAHGMYVFDSTMRIPFIVRPPVPRTQPQLQDGFTVSLVDVLPTALAVLGMPAPAGVDGTNVLADDVQRAGVYLEALTAQQRFGFHPELAAVSDGYKLIDTPSPMLFNTVADPTEQTNLIHQPEHTARIDALRGFLQQTWARTGTQTNTAIAPEVLNQLATLGYINNDFDHGDVSTIDAKDNVALIGQLEDIRSRHLLTADPAAAEQAFLAILEEAPAMAEARLGLARALSMQQRHVEAEAVYRDALALQPSSTVLRSNFAQSLSSQGRHEDGLAEMMAVLEQVPGDGIAQTGVLRMLTDLQRLEEGIALGEQWLAQRPTDHGLQACLGVLYAKHNQLERAQPLLSESLTDQIPRQLVHQILGNIAILNGDKPLALEHYRQEQQLFFQPNLFDETARLLFSMQRWAEAADDFEVYLDAFPDDHQTRRQQAQAVFNTFEYERAAEILSPALLAHPDDPDILLLHANILAKIGNYEEAQAVAERANALHEQRMEALREPLPDGAP